MTNKKTIKKPYISISQQGKKFICLVNFVKYGAEYSTKIEAEHQAKLAQEKADKGLFGGVL